MNIESILVKIDLFKELVIKSGFKRDVNDFRQSIQQAQNRNLVFMKGLSEKLRVYYDDFENNSLDSELKIVLKDSSPFTNLNEIEELDEIDSDSEIDANTYFTKLNSMLSRIKESIDSNESEINSIQEIFEKYIGDDGRYQPTDEQALMSLIFRDIKTTGSLREFSKVLHRWNRTLLIYHTLLKSESPEEISLVEIQNGSIDVIFNIDIDVAIDLAELIKIGLKVYGGYLVYKTKLASKTIEAFMGNKKLIDLEKKKEVLLLDNVKESVKQKALEQHKERLEDDEKIETGGIQQKVEEVSKVITDHIIKGNEIKLLTPPQVDEEDEEEELDLSRDLREQTAIVRENYKKLDNEDKLMLQEKYEIKEEEEVETKSKRRK